MDDGFLVLKYRKEELKIFLYYANPVKNNIQFAKESEENRFFLDVHITKKPEGTISHRIYRKLTHTTVSERHFASLYSTESCSIVYPGTPGLLGEQPRLWEDEKQYLHQASGRNGYKKKDDHKTDRSIILYLLFVFTININFAIIGL